MKTISKIISTALSAAIIITAVAAIPAQAAVVSTEMVYKITDVEA